MSVPSPKASFPSRPASVWVCRLQGGMEWVERELDGPGGSGLAAEALPRRSCREVGSVRRDSWLLEERLQGSRPVTDVRSEDWRLLLWRYEDD